MSSKLPFPGLSHPFGAFSCLKQGASGPEVEYLQQQLQAAGLEPGPVDGLFGVRTRAALMSFQRSRGLEVDGIASPRTWAALDVQRGSGMRPMLRRGVSDPVVEVLQKLLAARGHDPGARDGCFGHNTERAVMAFQRAMGLEANGVVGTKTWRALDMAAPQSFPAVTSVGAVLPDSSARRDRSYSL